MTVQYAINGRTKLSIDLRRNGGQWNTLDYFPLDTGVRAAVLSSREPSLGDGVLWVVDAFRFTRVASRCNKRPYESLFTLQIKDADLDLFSASEYEAFGLLLRAAVAEAGGLQLDEVRLLGLRTGSIIADFEARGQEAKIVAAMKRLHGNLGSDGNLSTMLCAAARGGESCAVEAPLAGERSHEQQQSEQGNAWLVPVLLAAAGVALLGCLCCAYRFAGLCKARSRRKVAPAPAMVFADIEVRTGLFAEAEAEKEAWAVPADPVALCDAPAPASSSSSLVAVEGVRGRCSCPCSLK